MAAKRSSARTPADEPQAVRLGREVHLNVLLLANRAYQSMDEICQQAGITHQQYIALWALCLADDPEAGIPMNTISNGLINRASDTTRMVDRLVKAGLAERRPSKTDRRSVLVRATAEGRRVFDEVTPLVQAFHEREWANLSAAETKTLNDLLARALRGS